METVTQEKYKPFEFDQLKEKNIILFTDSLIWIVYGFQFLVMPSNRAANQQGTRSGIKCLDVQRVDLNKFGQFMKRLFTPGAFTDVGDMFANVSNPLLHMTRMFGLFCLYTGVLNMTLVFNYIDITDTDQVNAQQRRLNERFMFRAVLNLSIFILQMTAIMSAPSEYVSLTPRMIANLLVTVLPIVGLCVGNPPRQEKDYMYPQKIDAMGNIISQ